MTITILVVLIKKSNVRNMERYFLIWMIVSGK